ncbi:MAG: ribonuclease J [Patescibacteria group bacterium]
MQTSEGTSPRRMGHRGNAPMHGLRARPMRNSVQKRLASGPAPSARPMQTEASEVPPQIIEARRTLLPQRGNDRGPRQPMHDGGRHPRGAGGARPQVMREQSFGSGADKVRVIVLGGLEEVGRNCTLIEYKNDIIFVDMGLQFPDEDMPGIDYIIPNVSYVKGKEKNVRGVIITHGHYDHIGGIPHIVPEMGNPPVYGLPLTLAIIKKRQEDFGGYELNLRSVTLEETLQLGHFRIEFFHVNHNIPDSMGVVIHTAAGTIIHTGDWKFDFQPVDNKPANLGRLAEIGSKGVLALLSDSTNANCEGHQISEHTIGQALEAIFVKAQGRIIIGTFASLLSRVQQVIEIATKLGKKLAIDGYSMKTNVEIMKMLKYMEVPKSVMIGIDEIDDYPKEKVIIMCTGAQGEKSAVLMRIASNEHRFAKIIPGDTVVFSSSVIPGNERSVQRLMDVLFRRGANVINYTMMDVHSGGHAKTEDIKLMLQLIRPKYFVPIHGNHFMLRYNAKAARAMKWPEENIFVADNGQVMEFDSTGKGVLLKDKVDTEYVFVDGLGVGDVGAVVLRDRQALSEDGMVVIIATMSHSTGKLTQNPDIISRGFVHLKEQKDLIEDVRKRARTLIEKSDEAARSDANIIKNKLRDDLGEYLYTKTKRRPMILPVLIEV